MSDHSPPKTGEEDDLFPGQDPDDPPPPLMDFGDLPDWPDDDLPEWYNQWNGPRYPTLLTNDGPRHVIDVNGVILGSSMDNELDGQPHPQALGDDLAQANDAEKLKC